MSGWDFFRQQLESAGVQAQAAASQASKFAETVSAQVSEQSKVLAEQATSYSAAAAEHASQMSKAAAVYSEEARTQIAGMQLPDALANFQLPESVAGLSSRGGPDGAPSEAELESYSISLDFRDFIRSLTYSTFRDFPHDQIPALNPPTDTDSATSESATSRGADGGSEGLAVYLTPWQARHAVLICQSVSEMNELRFVLVPKRLSDEQFWGIYFSVTRSRLPAEAFHVIPQHQVAPRTQSDEEGKSVLRILEDLRQVVRPAVPAAEGEALGVDTKAWLRNLVCGFDMDIPLETVQERTIVLGAIQGKLMALQASARNFTVPEDVRQNISDNLASARDFIGLSHSTAPPAASARDGAPEPRMQGTGDSETSAGTPLSRDASGGPGDDEPLPRPSAPAAQGAEEVGDAPGDEDPELEAYLQEIAQHEGGDAQEPDDGGEDDSGSGSADDGDFAKYLEELNREGENGGSDEEGMEVEGEGSDGSDFEDYIDALQNEVGK